jgi:hypothetical protein
MTGVRVVSVADIIAEREHWEIEAGYGPGEYQKACLRRVDICNLALAAAPAEQAAAPQVPSAKRRGDGETLPASSNPAPAAAPTGCPCTLTTPCGPNCTCSDIDLSGGCLRCCAYGSLEQRKAMAVWLASKPNPGSHYSKLPATTATDNPKGADAPAEAAAHTDHPLRHYDRTCPACNEKGADAPANAADPRLLLNPITLRTEPWSTDLITENENLSSELLDVRDKLSASDKENSSLRAECRLRQIAGYAKGKFDQDSVIDELKGKLAAAKRERDQLREWQTRANSCMDKLEARAEAAELRAEQIAAETIEQCTEVCDAMILTIGDKEISGMHERADGCKNGLENAARKIRALSAADIYAAIAGKRKE